MKLSKKIKVEVTKVKLGKDVKLKNVADMLYVFSDIYFNNSLSVNQIIGGDNNSYFSGNNIKKQIVYICKLLSDDEVNQLRGLMKFYLHQNVKNLSKLNHTLSNYYADETRYQYLLDILEEEKLSRLER